MIFLFQLSGFLSLTFIFVNFSLIACIALDRLLITLYSHRFPNARRRVIIMSIVSWCTAIGIVTVMVAGLNERFQFDRSVKHCTLPIADDMSEFQTATISMYFGLIVPSLIICYLLITFRLWREGKRLSRHYQLSEAISPSTPRIDNASIENDNQVVCL